MVKFTIFCCGDVMIGRGIDQILKYKSDSKLYESYLSDAKDYVPDVMKLYTKNNKYVSDTYVWGNLLKEILFVNSDLKLINLETSITDSNDALKGKPVLYKMHPKNINVITSAHIDYCNMANNHVLDWGVKGLIDTVNTLNNAHIGFGGIGLNLEEAMRPTITYINGSRILIFSFGDVDSGIPNNWKASASKPGVNVISSLDDVDGVVNHINKYYNDGDFIIVSIHWGSNWGYEIESYHVSFAHKLIDNAHVNIIHGHSSHHFKRIEMYKNGIILYGCGDLINDYEIIDDTWHKQYMPEISLAYFLIYDNALIDLIIVPYMLKNMQLVSVDNMEQIVVVLNKICNGVSFIIDGKYIKMKKYIRYKNRM